MSIPSTFSVMLSKDLPQTAFLEAGVVFSKKIAQFRSTFILDYVVFKHLKNTSFRLLI